MQYIKLKPISKIQNIMLSLLLKPNILIKIYSKEIEKEVRTFNNGVLSISRATMHKIKLSKKYDDEYVIDISSIKSKEKYYYYGIVKYLDEELYLKLQGIKFKSNNKNELIKANQVLNDYINMKTEFESIQNTFLLKLKN